jgi:hypothetical protein
MLIHKKKGLIWVNLSLMMTLIGYSIFEDNVRNQQERIVFFDGGNQLALLYHGKMGAEMYLNDTCFKHGELLDFHTSGYLMTQKIKPHRVNLDQGVEASRLAYGKQNLLAIENKLLAFYNGEKKKYQCKMSCDYLIIRKLPWGDPVEYIAQYEAKTIILSPELWDNQKKQLKKLFKDTQTPVYDISEQGAYVVDLNQE